MKLNDAYVKMIHEMAQAGYAPTLGTFPHADDIDSVSEHCGKILDAVGTYLKTVIGEGVDLGVTDIGGEVDAFFHDLKSEIRAAYSAASEPKRERAE